LKHQTENNSGGLDGSKNEFSHSLALEPTTTAPSVFVRHWRSSAKKPQDASSGQLRLKTPLRASSCENQASSFGSLTQEFRGFSAIWPVCGKNGPLSEE
jgi:hypothetical protein